MYDENAIVREGIWGILYFKWRDQQPWILKDTMSFCHNLSSCNVNLGTFLGYFFAMYPARMKSNHLSHQILIYGLFPFLRPWKTFPYDKNCVYMFRFYHIMTAALADVFMINLVWCYRSNHFVETSWHFCIILCTSLQKLSILTGQLLHLFTSVAWSLNY